MEGNHRFMRGVLEPHPVVALRKKLAEGQHPNVGILACADSRVAPEIVFDKNLGDLFVVRVAETWPSRSASQASKYGVEHLGVKLVVGDRPRELRRGRGGRERRADANEKSHGARRGDPPRDRVGAEGWHPAEFSLRQVEANVRAATRSLIEMSPVLRHELDDKRITILRCVYHLESGEVTRLAD